MPKQWRSTSGTQAIHEEHGLKCELKKKEKLKCTKERVANQPQREGLAAR